MIRITLACVATIFIALYLIVAFEPPIGITPTCVQMECE